ncbi:hypothetical protein F4553_005077 [Allocatelliglobosispora scoriae]|uniref:Uncharacterized protein n=1 Tax=Allocatelliglobosispora scoriae TaxID=643052 RepID=A0A841BW48_9ACTN|nr:hypothetical protein [Allocatelliglobosispora scoriae]MBB5871698.1 hypothetical protein [Allocatelliglobosispora scoriae]
MRYLIVRTEVRTFKPEEVNAAWDEGGSLRDECEAPELRRQTAEADNLDSALHLARALASVGAVRSGRQRVKVLRIGQPRLLY